MIIIWITRLSRYIFSQLQLQHYDSIWNINIAISSLRVTKQLKCLIPLSLLWKGDYGVHHFTIKCIHLKAENMSGVYGFPPEVVVAQLGVSHLALQLLPKEWETEIMKLSQEMKSTLFSLVFNLTHSKSTQAPSPHHSFIPNTLLKLSNLFLFPTSRNILHVWHTGILSIPFQGSLLLHCTVSWRISVTKWYQFSLTHERMFFVCLLFGGWAEWHRWVSLSAASL